MPCILDSHRFVCTNSARVPPHGGFVRWSTRPLDLFRRNGSDDSGPSIWHTMSQNQRCSEFYEYGADGHPEETRPSTFLASLLLLKSPRLDFHMKRQSNHRSRNDSPRIVGTYAERICSSFTERGTVTTPTSWTQLRPWSICTHHRRLSSWERPTSSRPGFAPILSAEMPKQRTSWLSTIQRRLVFEDPWMHSYNSSRVCYDVEGLREPTRWQILGTWRMNPATHLLADASMASVTIEHSFIASPMTRATHASHRKSGLMNQRRYRRLTQPVCLDEQYPGVSETSDRWPQTRVVSTSMGK